MFRVVDGMMTHVVTPPLSIGLGAIFCNGFIRYNLLEKGEGDLVPIMGRKLHSQKAIRSLSIVPWTA